MLRIYAKPGHVLYEPGTQQHGAPPRYFGRIHKVRRDQAGTITEITQRASSEAVAIDETEPRQGERVRRLVERCTGDVNSPDPLGAPHGAPVWAADRETAQFLGIPYVSVKYDELAGEWVEASTVVVPSESANRDKSKSTKSAPKEAEL